MTSPHLINTKKGKHIMRTQQIFDNPEFFDRYTVVTDEYTFDNCYLFDALTLSENCDSPQGFSQWCQVQTGDHLGDYIDFCDLPENVQKHITRRLK